MKKHEETIDLSKLLNGDKVAVADGEDFVTASLIVDCHCELGEGVVFDDKSHAVLWTDILGKRLHKLQLDYDEPSKAQFSTFDLPKQLGSFGMLAAEHDSSRLPLLCAWEDGFQLYDVENAKELSAMSTGEDVNPEKGPTRMNDGRVDPTGQRFVSGGYYGDVEGFTMKVFRCEQNAKDGSLVHTPMIENVRVTNSISWSPDGSTMYFADSPTKQIVSYQYANGKLDNKKLVHHKQIDAASVPDGSCVDAEGFLWNAVWRAGTAPGLVQRIDPVTGNVVFTVHVPDTTSQVTCCCFGGKDLDILFITSAAESRPNEPHAGGLYAVRLPFQGRKESRLKFKLPARM